MTDMYKNQLEQGIARSVFNQEDAFVKGIIENFTRSRKLKYKESDLNRDLKNVQIIEKQRVNPEYWDYQHFDQIRRA